MAILKIMGLFDIFKNDDYLEMFPFELTFKTFLDGLNQTFFYGFAKLEKVNKNEFALTSQTSGILTFTYKRDSITINAFLPDCFNPEFNYTFWGTRNANESTQKKMIAIFFKEINKI